MDIKEKLLNVLTRKRNTLIRYIEETQAEFDAETDPEWKKELNGNLNGYKVSLATVEKNIIDVNEKY